MAPSVQPDATGGASNYWHRGNGIGVMGNRLFTPEQELEIVARYEQVETARVVAEEFGTSGETIRRILKRHGVQRTHRHPRESKQRNWFDKSLLPVAIGMYRQGSNYKRIGDELGYSPGTIYNHLKAAGAIGNGACQLDRKQIAEICRLYDEGKTNREIAEQFGVCPQTITKVAKRNGLKMRGKEHNSYVGGAALAAKAHAEGIAKFSSVADVVELLDYVNADHATVRCLKCGETFNWGRSTWDADEPCPTCREKAIEEARAKREAEKLERKLEYEKKRQLLLSTPRTCKECGSTFYSEYDGATYCSEGCRRKSKNRQDTQRKRERGITRSKYRHRMRIPITPETYDRSVTLDAVFKKYHGRCCSCGRKTVRTKKHDPLQATLDHIIALGNNGTHTWDNVQLLCSECNSYKRDLGQIRLAI